MAVRLGTVVRLTLAPENLELATFSRKPEGRKTCRRELLIKPKTLE
jgi:hypothetical protein